MKLCQTSDDIWFFIQNFLKNNKTLVIGMPDNPFKYKGCISTNLLRDKNLTNDFRLCKDNSFFGNKNIENLKNIYILNCYKEEILNRYRNDFK